MNLSFIVYGDNPLEMENKAREVLNGIDSPEYWTWTVDATAMQSVAGNILVWEGRVHAERKAESR